MSEPPSHRVSSSTVLVAVASAFLVAMSVLGFIDGEHRLLGATWKLRGTLVPPAEASASRGAQGNRLKE